MKPPTDTQTHTNTLANIADILPVKRHKSSILLSIDFLVCSKFKVGVVFSRFRIKPLYILTACYSYCELCKYRFIFKGKAIKSSRIVVSTCIYFDYNFKKDSGCIFGKCILHIYIDNR